MTRSIVRRHTEHNGTSSSISASGRFSARTLRRSFKYSRASASKISLAQQPSHRIHQFDPRPRLLRADLARSFSNATFAQYNALAPDCGGGFQVWWMQSMPGYNSGILDNANQPILSWLPYMFY
jgi:hypothetical protein